MKEVPTRLDKDKLKEYAQLGKNTDEYFSLGMMGWIGLFNMRTFWKILIVIFQTRKL